MKVYLAGASKEAEMVRGWVDRCRDVGIEVTRDWASEVIAHQAKGGSDATLSIEERVKASLADLGGVCAADWVWLLVPAATRSAGCWVEFGKALGRTPIIVSGDWSRSIFTSLAECRFERHEMAFDWLAARARAR
jgi:hypothetical protein